jgi:hypothetical protein
MMIWPWNMNELDGEHLCIWHGVYGNMGGPSQIRRS